MRRPGCTWRCARPTRRAVVRAARASLTLNFEKSLKKNETAFDLSSTLRSLGSFGLSSPLPAVFEQNFPVKHGGASAAHNRRAGGRLRGGARTCVDGADGVGVFFVDNPAVVVDVALEHRGWNVIDDARPAGERVIFESRGYRALRFRSRIP